MEHEEALANAQADYQKELDAHPANLKAAELQFEQEMEEWKKKSLSEKVIEKSVLNENNKPVKRLPREPQLRHVREPELKTSYDYPLITDTYLQLDGFTKNPENAIKILVTLYGFDYTQPRQMTLQKNISTHANGKTTTRPVTYYYTEFSYRHPMAVQVSTPDGKLIINLTPQELNSYIVFKSGESDKPSQVNQEILIKSNEEKTLQANLTYINDLINDKIGFQKTQREVELYYIKAKDDTYKDLLIAFNDASSGLKNLIDNEETASAKLQNAIQLWNTALNESDFNNKKARINKDVGIAIYFNLLEVYFAEKNWVQGEKTIEMLNTIDLSSKERKQKEEYEALFLELRKRIKSQIKH